MESEKALQLLSDYEDATDTYAVHRLSGCDACQGDETAQARHDLQLLTAVRDLRARVAAELAS